MPLSSEIVVVALCYAFLAAGPLAYAQLTSTFYDQTCPNVTTIIRGVIEEALVTDSRIAASLIRLHFHDCFVNGCDASLLLDNSDDIASEKEALPNLNSVRGFDAVDTMKSRLETECPGIVSCADILAIAAEQSVASAGGPSWQSLLGRRDSRAAFQTVANTTMPAPFHNLEQLKSIFVNVGLNNNTDLVALSGAHTFGRSQCRNFINRTDDQMDQTFNASLRDLCSQNLSTLSNLDPTTPDGFDNNYFSNLQGNRGLLFSDQVLLSTPGADTIDIVNNFIANQSAFFESFVVSMIRMGNLPPSSETELEIRLNCRVVNPDSTALASSI